MSFAKNIVKNIRNNYGQKPLDGAKKSMTDAIKTTSKRASQITAEATGDFIGNKIADKIINVPKKSQNNLDKATIEADMSNEKYISPEKRQHIIEKLKLV